MQRHAIEHAAGPSNTSAPASAEKKKKKKDKSRKEGDKSSPGASKSKRRPDEDMERVLLQYADQETESWEKLYAEAVKFDDPNGKYMTYLSKNGFVPVEVVDDADAAPAPINPDELKFSPASAFENLTCDLRNNQSENEEWKRVQQETADLKLQLADEYFEPDLSGVLDESIEKVLSDSKDEITAKVFNELKSQLPEDDSSMTSSLTSLASQANLSSEDTEIDEQNDSKISAAGENKIKEETKPSVTAEKIYKSETGDTKVKDEEKCTKSVGTENKSHIQKLSSSSCDVKPSTSKKKSEVFVDLVDSSDSGDGDEDNEVSIVEPSASGTRNRNQLAVVLPQRHNASQSESLQVFALLDEKYYQLLQTKLKEFEETANDVYKYSLKTQDDVVKLKEGKKNRGWKYESRDLPLTGEFLHQNISPIQDLFEEVNEMIEDEKEKRKQQNKDI
jgi:hypothetical protein